MARTKQAAPQQKALDPNGHVPDGSPALIARLTARLVERHCIGTMIGIPHLLRNAAVGVLTATRTDERPFTPSVGSNAGATGGGGALHA